MTRKVGTTAEVIAAFVAGDNFPSRTATVNAGGARSRLSQDAGRLYSYRTAVAHRDRGTGLADWPKGPTFRLTAERYSVTTSRQMRALRARSPRRVRAGRTGSGRVRGGRPGPVERSGPAWAADPYPTVPAVLWTWADDPRAVAWAEHCDAILEADRAAREARRATARGERRRAARPDMPDRTDPGRTDLPVSYGLLARSGRRRDVAPSDPSARAIPHGNARGYRVCLEATVARAASRRAASPSTYPRPRIVARRDRPPVPARIIPPGRHRARVPDDVGRSAHGWRITGRPCGR